MPATLTLKAKVSGPCVICGRHTERTLTTSNASMAEAQDELHELTHRPLRCPLCADPAETAHHREY